MNTKNTSKLIPLYDYLTPEKQVQTNDLVSEQGWIVAIDWTTTDQPLADYPLILTPTTDGSRFAVFFASESLRIPEGSCLQPSMDGVTIRDENYLYRVLKCALVTPDEQGNLRGTPLLELPDKFQGSLILESEPTNPSLWEFLTEIEMKATDAAVDRRDVQESLGSFDPHHPLS